MKKDLSSEEKNNIQTGDIGAQDIREGAETTGSRILKGAVIIGAASLLVKIIGTFFRIPITNWLGAEGGSYYSVAYTIYGALLVLSTAGIPIAISRLVSENIAMKRYRNAHKVFRISQGLMIGIGLVTALTCLLGGGAITGFIGNPNARLAVMATCPALLCVPVVSSFRGYFQGRQNMKPTAISEIVEQLFRVAVGLALCRILLPQGTPKAAAGAAFGASAGSIFALAFMILVYMASRSTFKRRMDSGDQNVEAGGAILKKIVLIAIPIIIGAELLPIMNLLDSGIIMRRLQAMGMSVGESNAMYGLISLYCNPIIALPMMFTQAVEVSMVPAISGSFALGDHETVRDDTALSYRLAMIMAGPCAFGILALAEPILLMFFGSHPDEAHAAAPTLMILSAGVVLLAMSQTSTGLLQAIGKQTLPVRHLAIGVAVKVVLTFILVGIPGVNIKGAACGTLVAEAISFILNNIYVRKFTGVRIDKVRTYVKPLACSAVMGALAFGTHFLLSKVVGNTVSTAAAVLIGVISYAVLIVLTRTVNARELEMIPVGRRINGIISKFIRWE